MPTDPPDDDDELGLGIDLDNLLPPELQAEHDRLLAELEAEVPPRARLAPDLEALEHKIADVRIFRSVGIEDVEPHMFGRFETITTMRGGHGLVIKARDPQLEREVAIKLWMRSGPEAQQALRAEAKTLAKLKHPNVVTIYDTGVWNDRVYFVMEWIEGVDGHDWMDAPQPWRTVLEVYLAAGTGLAAAHDAGIQHRDFKPSNILIGADGRVVVADFGVADSTSSSPDREQSSEQSDSGAGTASYMAPERLRGRRGDPRSDQFSFCVAMWRALYRQRPYAGDTGEQLLASIERREIRATPGIDVPQWLSTVIRRGLADEPDQRYPSMHELLEALRDEPPASETDDEAGEHEAVAVEGRVLHSPERREPAGRLVQGSLAFTIALLSAVVAVLVAAVLTRSPAPAPAAAAATVWVEPYTAILGLVAADEFTKAQRVWLEHEPELTDEQSLRIARDCLARAQQLATVDRVRALEAAKAAQKIAAEIEQFGETPDVKDAGGRLAADAIAFHVDHPPDRAD